MQARARGFTLVELMVTLAVAGILLGVAVWQITAALPGYRANAAARRFLVELRNAQAIAARANEPVQVVRGPDADGCRPMYRIVQGAQVATGRELYRVCLNTDSPGVQIGAGGATDAVRCATDPAGALDNCSFCSEGSRITFLPTGEVQTFASGGGTQANGHAVIFAPNAGDTPLLAQAIGIRSGTGRARAYRYAPSTETKWECP